MEYKDFLSKLSNPAKSALEYEGIDSFTKLASLTEKELLSFHGFGPKSVPIVMECLKKVGMKLK
jgi:DNA-directed RNA polymerase alpha subunit